MESGSPIIYHDTDESQYPQEKNKPKLKFPKELSREEREIFRQCNHESFMYRSLPFAAIGMTATYFAVKKGYLTSNPRWGPSLKMTGAAVVGWLIGKLSYSHICQEKFLHLENSYIGDVIRSRRGYSSEMLDSEFSYTKPFEEDFKFKDDSFNYQSDADYHSSAGSLNLDVDKNIQYSGFDDRERPSIDREDISISEEVQPVKKFTTYEDLRRKNREEYERSQRPYTSKPDQLHPSGMQRPWSNVDNTPRSYSNSTFGGGTSSNQDSWESNRS